MNGLRRIGSLLESSRQDETGERRILQAAENLAMHVLFLEVSQDFGSYRPRQPTVQPDIPNLPPDIEELGEYESMLLGKLLNPSSPVVCIHGAMGSGKTTTINYLITHILQRMSCDHCKADGLACDGHRLVAHVDFGDFVHRTGEDELEQIRRLLNPLCDELRARSTTIIEDVEECFDFWQEIVELYYNDSSREVSRVARRLIVEAPWLRNEADRQAPEELSRRVKLRTRLARRDIEWYLRYMILLWRRLLQTHFGGQRECALVVLDNVDTLPTNLQRLLVDFVMRSASLAGPTFFILMRPETRMRHGLADGLLDVVEHQGPEPFQVILDRLTRFCRHPEHHFQPELGLTKEQYELVEGFVQRMYQQMTRDHSALARFIRSAAGRSIRAALLLAQGLFLVRIADMGNPNVTTHFLLRACVTQGSQQFTSSPRNPIDNPFHVQRVEEGRFLLKPRILNYLATNDDRCSLSLLRSAFTLFGYPETSIRNAVNELMRTECQLVRSDGLDVYRHTWGDEQETLYLTEIGRGYQQHLIYDVDFLQEVILDAYVDLRSGSWPRRARADHLTEKLRLVYYFFRDLNRADVHEVRDFVQRQGAARYVQLFGPRLISLDIIHGIYDSVGRLLCSLAGKYPRNKASYRDLLTDFTSLVRICEGKSEDLLGLRANTVHEYVI